ncbi:MAG: response regulator [Candidatus Latescibacteria bacterium]|nr:response regulator [Candidatus Latescibacterota bacterium]
MAGERVLIVDDDPFTLELLTESLSEQGFRTVAVQDGERALEVLRQGNFRVALIDLSLPGMGGMDLVREVNLTAPETTMVIMTGYPTQESAIQALRQGAYDYIVKPFKIHEVTATLEKALAQQTLKAEVGALRARVRELELELKRHQEGTAGGIAGQLAGGVAHEVNNPLQIILSRVQLLMMRHRDVPRLQDDLRLIESNVKRISRIIRSLLDFARYNSGEMEWSDIDVAHLARQTCTLIQHQLDKSGISLTLEAPADLPKVYGNAGEIEQVFLNLLLNAQHATTSGGRIEIRIRTVEKSVVVQVCDTGTGIPKEVLPKIFEPFFTTRSAEGGTGLGLSIIYGIIQKHRGKIEVESQVGVGTTFTIHFPISEREDEG